MFNIKSTSDWKGFGQNKDKTFNIVCGHCGAGFKTRAHANSAAIRTKWVFCPTCGTKMIHNPVEEKC